MVYIIFSFGITTQNYNNMTKETALKLFEEQQIRSIWNEEDEKWYFSIVDVVGVLSESLNPNNYWKVLKNR